MPTQAFITKWLSEDTATGRVMVRRRQRQYSFYPRCQAPDEHLLHILTCPHTSTRDLHLNIIQNLHQWLSKAKTYPDITSFFTLGLTQWFRHQTSNWNQSSELFTNDLIINRNLTKQLSLGWFSTLCGFLSSSLINIQQTYFTEIA